MDGGDWTGAPVFLLFLPGAIFPLTFFLKWLTFKIALKDVSEIPIRYFVVAAFIESVNPLLIALTEFIAIDKLARAYIQVGIEFIIPIVFFSCLFILNLALNRYILAKILKQYHSNYMLLIFAAAAMGTVSFPLAWFMCRSIA
jgi:hypothetical protein